MEGFWKPDGVPASISAQRYNVFATIAQCSDYAKEGKLRPFLLKTFKTNIEEGWAGVTPPITERDLFAGMEKIEEMLKGSFEAASLID